MTLQTEITRWSYAADGTADDFDYERKITAASDLLVYLTSDAGVEYLQVFGVDYTVSGVGANAGGTVTFNTPPANGYTVLIYCSASYTQPTDLLNSGRFLPESHQNTFDRLAGLIQQLNDRIKRTLRFNIRDDEVSDARLSDALSKFPYIDASGELTFVTGDPSQPVTHVVHIVYPSNGATVITVPTAYTPGSYDLSVFLNGVKLVIDDDYTESSTTTITLAIGATSGDVIEFDVGTVYDVTLAQSSREEQSFTGLTAPTITLTTISYTPGTGSLDVFMNGVRLAASQYTETNTTTITLAFTPIATDEFTVVVGRVMDVTAVTRNNVGAVLYPITAMEIAASVIPTDYAYAPGDVRRYGFNGDGGTTDNTVAFQSALTANAGFVPVVVPNMGAYAKLTGRVTAPANTTIVLENNAELRWTATAATGSTLLDSATRPGIEVTGDNFTIEGKGIIAGPLAGVYVGGEIGIFAKGTNTATRKTGFTIGGEVEIRNWGYAGWVCQFVNGINASGFHTHDCGHAGWFAFSCSHSEVYNFETGDITPGTGGNAYGYSCTHDSTGYSTDPNIATPRLVANPFCIDFKVHDFTVYNVPLWTGADSHGGHEVEFYNFHVYNCRGGAHIASGSGDALNYGGENCKIYNFHITTKRRDGSTTTVAAVDMNGIVLNGGSSRASISPMAYNGTLDGYGDNANTSHVIQGIYCDDVKIHDITLTNWRGYGVYTSGSSGDVDRIRFSNPASATNSRCLSFDTTTKVMNSSGCTHRVQSGVVAGEGIRVAAGNPRGLHIGNDLASATVPDVTGGGTTLGASDAMPSVTVADADITANAFSIAACGRAPRVRVYVSLAGAQTVADITGAFVGQIITIHCNDGNLTFNRTNAALSGGANFTSSQFDVLELLCISTSGTKFVEIGRSANS